MDVLKHMIEVHKNTFVNVSKYQVYDALEKVPTEADQERIANNVSKEMSARLKAFAKNHRLPLQDVVELAIIERLDKYDK